jgi:photosystem II stability/assembly factor-like uncharacterized protein
VATVVWALCVTGLQSGLTRSTDGGATFPPFSNSQGFVNTAGLAAVSATSAVVTALAGGGQAMYLTTDGGRSFQLTGPVLAPGGSGWGFVGFTDATHGAAIAATTPAVLYSTTDGGHTWNPVSIRA